MIRRLSQQSHVWPLRFALPAALMLALLAGCGSSLEYAGKKKTGGSGVAPMPIGTPAEGEGEGVQAPSKPDDHTPAETDKTPPPAVEGELEVAFVDVGQGDGIIVISPSGRTVVIDAGVNDGGVAMVKFLQARSITRVDLMVLTHPHADHIGGADEIINAVEVLRILDPGTTHTSATFKKLMKLIDERSIPVLKAERGRRIKLDEGLFMVTLAPFDEYFEGTRSDANANSVVLRLDYGKVSFMFTGDAEHETEDELIKHDGKDTPLSATVLKVAHHGSGYASTDAFLNRVKPIAAVISCGAGNTYGHPVPETVERIQKHTKNRIWRTDLHGTTRLVTDGNRLRAIPSKGEAVEIAVP